jgi:hypothetical protein
MLVLKLALAARVIAAQLTIVGPYTVDRPTIMRAVAFATLCDKNVADADTIALVALAAGLDIDNPSVQDAALIATTRHIYSKLSSAAKRSGCTLARRGVALAKVQIERASKVP